MSESKTRKKPAAAVLRVYPSDAAIEWLKTNYGPGWRTTAAQDLERHLTLRADGDYFARIHAGALEGLSTSDRQSVLGTAESAGLKRATELRAENRKESLLAGYTPEELRAALAALDEPEEEELQGMLDAHPDGGEEP